MGPPWYPPNTPPLSCSAFNPDGSSSPPPSGKGVPSNVELADLSRIFCEVVLDLRSDLLSTPEFVQVHQFVYNIITRQFSNSNVVSSSSGLRTGTNGKIPLKRRT